MLFPSTQRNVYRTDIWREFNGVIEQVYNLAKTSIVQNAWDINQELHLHGWVYGLNSGYVTDLDVNFSNNDDLDSMFKLNF